MRDLKGMAIHTAFMATQKIKNFNPLGQPGGKYGAFREATR